MTPEWSDVGARVLASSPQDSSILVLLALFGASFGFFVPAGELSSSSFRPASFRLAPVAGFFVAFLLPSAMIQSVGSDSGLLCCGSGCTLGWCSLESRPLCKYMSDDVIIRMRKSGLGRSACPKKAPIFWCFLARACDGIPLSGTTSQAVHHKNARWYTEKDICPLRAWRQMYEKFRGYASLSYLLPSLHFTLSFHL